MNLIKKFKIKNSVNKLTEIFKLLFYYKTIKKMFFDKKNGLKIIVYQLGSLGQLQYLMPIHKELIKQSNLLSIYLCTSYPIPEAMTELGLTELRCLPSKLGKYLFLADLFVCTEIQFKGYEKAIKIFSGHGHANKLSYWGNEYLKSLDIYFLYSPLEREMFKVIQHSNPAMTKHIKLINVGYPKIDDLVNGHYDRNQIMERLILDPNLKTIIYSPAWDPGGSLRTFGTQIAEILLSIPNINVLVKLHPASMEKKSSPNFHFYTGNKVWEDEFNYLKNNSRFRFINDFVINPYLFISDLMVNDFSGVALEYMALNRPIIYLDCPEYYEKILPDWKCDPEMAKNDERFNAGRHVGSVVQSLEQLKIQVINELNEPKLNEDKRKLFIKKVMYNPGKGAFTAASEILSRLEIN